MEMLALLNVKGSRRNVMENVLAIAHQESIFISMTVHKLQNVCHAVKTFFLLVCSCPKILKPVCGTNGKLYGNSCLAKCEGVKKDCDGKCPCKRKYRNKLLHSAPNTLCL